MTRLAAGGPAALCLIALASLGSVDCAVAQQFTNPSFEQWGPATFCGVNTEPDAWIDFNGSGAPGVDEGNFAVCPHSIPSSAHSGDAYCRAYSIASGGEGIAQTVNGFVPGRTYRIGYFYSGSNVYGGVADGMWRTYVDGVNVDESPVISSLQTTWSERTFTFVATSTQHQIGFRGWRAQSGSGSASLGIDDVSIQPVASTIAYGSSCSVGSPLVLGGDAPTIGSNWTLTGTGIEPVSTLAVFWFGSAALTPAVDLTSAGAAGCFAHTNGNLGAFVAPASGGGSSYVVAVPNSTALNGAELFVQMSATSTATTIGFTTSNGLVGSVGV